LLLLLIVFGVWYALVIFEREMAITMLHEDIPPVTYERYSDKTTWQKLVATLKNPVTWKGLVYLFAKFPLGMVSFVVLVTFISLSGSLMTAPFYYSWEQPQVQLDLGSLPWNQAWLIDTLPEALIACLAGIFILLVSMHIFNGLAWISGKFARVMLGNFSNPPAGGSESQPQPPAGETAAAQL
jgi:hypothetical protein